MPFELKFSRPTLETEVFDVFHERAEHPSGAAIERHIVHNPAAAVVCARREREVLLIRQFRLAARESLWELPAGKCDPGEDVAHAASRELTEETGYRAERWTSLTDFYPAPGFASELMTAFLAEDVTEGEASPEPYEIIEPRWFAWSEALRMIRDGEIRDAKTVLTLLYVDRFDA